MSAREWVDWVVGGCELRVDVWHLCGCYLWRLRKIGQEMWRGKKDDHSLKRSERRFPKLFFGVCRSAGGSGFFVRGSRPAGPHGEGWAT